MAEIMPRAHHSNGAGGEKPVHPILFHIGSLPIATYGVLIMIGLLVSLPLAGWLGARRGIPPQFFYDLALVLLISGFLGARLFYIIQNFGEFLEEPLAMLLSRQGFVFLGGFVLALACGIWFARRRGFSVWEIADVVAPPLALAHGIGRIGCFFAGCCFGDYCTPGHNHWLAPIATQYPLIMENGKPAEQFNFAYFTQIEQGLLQPGATQTLPLIPVQLMEMAGNFLICFGLVMLWRRRRFSGQIFAVYLAAYSVLRFLLEFWRGDDYRGLYFGGSVSTSQLITLGTVVVAGVIWWLRRGKGIAPLPAPAGEAAGTDAKKQSAARKPRKANS